MVTSKQDLVKNSSINNYLEYLSEASKVLASSLDYKKTLANIAKLSVPQMADWCSVTLKNGDEFEELAIAHVDPKKVKWAKELRRKHPPKPNAETGAYKVMKTGKSELYPVITEAMLKQSAQSKEQFELLKKLQLSSVMIVPLVLKKRSIGVITFVAAEGGRHYNETDLLFAEELANRMAMAIQNARLYQKAQTADVVQKRLALVVESSDDAIIANDTNGVITSWNKGAEKLYGYKTAEIVGQSVEVLMPSRRKSDFPKILKAILKGQGLEHYETQRKTKDGRILDVSLTISPIKDSRGRVIGASKIARDITERKLAEQRQKFLDKATDSLGHSIDYETTLQNLSRVIIPEFADYSRIVIVDNDKKIKEITTKHKDIKKLSLVEDLYQAYKDTLPTAGVGKILKTGKPELIPQITPQLLKSASPNIVNLIQKLGLTSYMGVPLKIGNKIIGAITFSSTRPDRLYDKDDLKLAVELSRRAALAVENARLFQQSQKAVEIRDEFISVASHELKTPITSLKMYIQITKKQLQDNGQSLGYVEKMDNQVGKITKLIQDLLNVSRFQSGRFEYNDSFFDLNHLIEEVVDNLKPTSDKHVIKVEGSVSSQTWGDRDRISQVLTNLVSNAIKYSPQSNQIVVKVMPSPKNRVKVVVKDFGIGIDKKHQSKLFERFYRVNDEESKTFPGLGLGLYISNEIIKRYGDSIKVQSQKGHGSEFSFSLPLKEPEFIQEGKEVFGDGYPSY